MHKHYRILEIVCVCVCVCMCVCVWKQVNAPIRRHIDGENGVIRRRGSYRRMSCLRDCLILGPSLEKEETKGKYGEDQSYEVSNSKGREEGE